MPHIASFNALSDPELWKYVCLGNESAFEVAVQRYQTLVSAIAYNTCGDQTLSEDVAQETFWAAWRERLALEDPGKLKGWLCGIARNLAHHARIRTGRKADAAAASTDAIAEVSAGSTDPAEAAVTREEEQLVWQTLEQIPETYREPLILFYREQQSVEEVAKALDLTEETARQRLSRGRALLRDQVAELVAGALVRGRPTRKFTVAVLAGLGMTAGGTQAALAGTAVAGSGVAGAGIAGKAAAAGPAAVVGTGIAAGVVGGLLGALGGLAGGWLGCWLPAQLAPTRNERLLIERRGARILMGSVLCLLALLGAAFWGFQYLGPFGQVLMWIGCLGACGIYIMAETMGLVRAIQRLRREQPTDSEANNTPLRSAFSRASSRYRGRVYTSPFKLLGLPVIDINVSDPQVPQAGRPESQVSPKCRVARGWIAIGDEACGVLLAMGGKARGLVAIGGRAVGLISLGGVAFGGLAVGGLAMGIVGVGGAACGVLGLGGLAAGWHAVGGGAFAWDTAVGGLAVAHDWAAGGGAFAADMAFGGMASATHANDELAKATLENHRYLQGMKWWNEHIMIATAMIVAASVLPTLLVRPVMYRRENLSE